MLARLELAIRRFMAGRYGTDGLHYLLMALWFLIALVDVFLSHWLVSLLQTAICIFIFFRMFSRNIIKRQRENQAFLSLIRRIGKTWRHFQVRFTERKTTCFFHCPQCKAPMKMPRRAGRFTVHCPCCHHSFEKEIKG
jgi:hypothetical protein